MYYRFSDPVVGMVVCNMAVNAITFAYASWWQCMLQLPVYSWDPGPRPGY